VSDGDKVFAGSIPKLYETHLVPLIFEPYAEDLARRLGGRSLGRVLEIAAGTGVVTRRLASTLPESVSIVATDLNQAMIDQAKAVGTKRPVEWRQADAQALPFADATFGAVVCQFGVMFFPDKTKAYAEARRVLRPGGVLLFNVWDKLEENEFPHEIETALAASFPSDPPRFLSRTPYAHHDRAVIARDLANAGFTESPRFESLTARSRASSARIPALAFCRGTPLRGEIEARGAARLDEATDAAAAAISKRFGAGAVDGKIQALVVSVER